MGIEILVGVLVCVSMAVGIVIPVAGWALWLTKKQRVLLETLHHRRCAVLAMLPSSAQTPLNVEVAALGRRVLLQAQVRGQASLWRIVVERTPTAPGAFAMVRTDWLPATRAPAAWRLRHQTDGRAWLSPDDQPGIEPAVALRTMLDEWAADERVTELLVEDHALTLQVERAGLSAEDAVPWLHKAAQAVTALDGPPPEPTGAMALLPHRTGAGHQGSPVGVAAV